VQSLAQVVPGLSFSGIRPEKEGKLLSGLWGVAMEKQISQQ
jgi:hypothetical protein